MYKLNFLSRTGITINLYNLIELTHLIKYISSSEDEKNREILFKFHETFGGYYWKNKSDWSLYLNDTDEFDMNRILFGIVFDFDR